MLLFSMDFDVRFICLILAVLMGLAALAGWRNGNQRAKRGLAEKFSVNEPILAIFGLLLGFTFSMSLGKHDQRRLMLVNDSNAIGDFSTCTAMLPEPHASRLLLQIKNYLQLLLNPLKTASDAKAINQRLDELQAMQADMQTSVKNALADKPVVAIPLVNTFNELTSTHAARLASLRDQLPWSVLILLFLAGMVTMFLQGKKQGELGEKQVFNLLGLILLINLVIWVTLDLNQPGRGWITLSNEPLERLLSGLSR